jgi:hypothetical protein
MHHLLIWVARIAGLAGVALCGVACIARVMNVWMLGAYAVGALLQAGLAGMLLACLAYLADLAERPRA